jgi:hypothetical protein
MGVALIWSCWESLVEGKGYPESYVLGFPDGRFSDFTNVMQISTLPNPYIEAIAVYPPATFVLSRLLAYTVSASLVFICFLSIFALALLLVRVLAPMAAGAWARTSMAFFFLVLCYPLLFCIDRGNLEILMYPFIAWAIYFYGQRRDLAGTACLLPAICLKLYPAIFMVLLLRRRKAGLAILGGITAIAVTVICFCSFQEPAAVLWNSYLQDLDFFHDCYIVSNDTIGNSPSPWNVYKIILLGLQNIHLIPPVTFRFDGAFINASYRVYSTVFALFTLFCMGYACLYERRLARGILMLLLLISISTPNGGDYRLTYTSMALILLVLLPDRRKGDYSVLVLLALAVVPKREIFLTETGYPDVPIQALLNPVLILVAMGMLLYQSRHFLDWRRARQRLGDLLPWRWRWV